MTLGWECPKCGAVMAPHIDVCVNCKGITWTTITTADYGCIHEYNLISSSAGSYYKCQKCGKEVPVTIWNGI